LKQALHVARDNREYRTLGIRNTEYTVSDVLGWLASGKTPTDILNDCPELTLNDIKATMAYARCHGGRFRLSKN
jgi:uncharacterized protein (DUF433 family)